MHGGAEPHDIAKARMTKAQNQTPRRAVSPVTELVPAKSRPIRKSSKLNDVCYDIRGPVPDEATRLEEEGHRIIKRTSATPRPSAFDAPEEILRDVIHNLPRSQGYCGAKGLYSARKAVMQYMQQLGAADVDIDDVYIGNGVSELLMMALQGLLEIGDEVLIPAPDYPLWTAAVNLCDGKPVHYLCNEDEGWAPDLADLEAKITPPAPRSWSSSTRTTPPARSMTGRRCKGWSK